MTFRSFVSCSVMLIVLLVFISTQPVSAQKPGAGGPYVGPSVKGVSFNGDLRKLPNVKPNSVPRPNQLKPWLRSTPSRQPTLPFRDPVRQTQRAPVSMPSPIRNFIGLPRFEGSNTWGVELAPDTTGDIGPNHYIQTVHDAFAIYDKGGTRLVAMTFNTLWSGANTGTYCDNIHEGDPSVIYDVMADRWVMGDMADPGTGAGPFYYCLAVSKSGDPVTGGWYLYPLQEHVTYFNDVPKMGFWPDAYYMAGLLRNPSAGWGAVNWRVWALDRVSMLSGTLNSLYFDLPPSVTTLSALPSNLHGALPPSGTPNFFAAVLAPSTFDIWKFHVDWAVPANSTLTGPTSLSVASFTNYSPALIPELGGIGGLWATSGNILAPQLQYRNIGGVESLWANHTVASGGVVGIRWYQILNPNGTPTIGQQSTFQPDGNYRWTGSLAADGNGNMALGYSHSSTSTVPIINYAGRLTTDASGTLGQGEATLFAGTGAQDTDVAWGGYTVMTVDPVDDCTFWYSNEYYQTTGTNWQTRIGAFKFPSCNPTPYPTNHTITFDGVVNPNIEWNPNGDKLGTMGGIDYYATWDATNLSVAMVGGSLSTNTYVVVVDTDATNRSGSNTGSSAQLGCASFNGNGKGNLALTRSAGTTTKYDGGSGSWSAWSPSSGTSALDNGTNNVEFQLKWSDIGLPPTSSTAGLYMYVCNGTSLVSAWPPENLQSGTNPVLNVETSFGANDSGRIPRTFSRHIGDEQLTISNGGSFNFLNGYVQLANVSGLSGACSFTANVFGNADTLDTNIIRRTYSLVPGSCTGLMADLTLKYEDGSTSNGAPNEIGAFNEGTMAMLRKVGSNWVDQSATSRDTVANTITKTNVNSFSDWTLGTGSGPTALFLSSFNERVVRENVSGNIALTWTTESEINTAGFNLYRSEDMDGPYARVNRQLIPASGNSFTGSTYEFKDSTVIPGQKYYYQLEEVEWDGTSVRQQTISVIAPANE